MNAESKRGHSVAVRTGGSVPDVGGLHAARELVVAFLARRSDHTRRAYDGDLRAFAEHVGKASGAEAVQAVIDAGPRGSIPYRRQRRGLMSFGEQKGGRS